jgi:Carboxypeptidase regulatory-like domain
MSTKQLFRWFCAVGIVVCNSPPTAPQSLPPRDRPPQQAGTGRIKGRVVDAQTGSVVLRARVRISGPQLTNRSPAVTDDSGAFEFANLVPGRFFLTVMKAGYANSPYPEQGRTLRGGDRPLMVGEHETVANLVVPLYRGAAITGRVVDVYGDPVENAWVQVLRVAAHGRANNIPSNRGGTSTNDLGEFRVSRLQPGSYVLFVSPRNQGDDPSEWQPAPTYSGGAASLAEAQRIVLERAQSVSGVEIVLGEATAAPVSGTVIDTKGEPLRDFAFINARRVSEAYYGGIGGQVRDGTFKLHLTPGEYELETRGPQSGVMGSPRSGEELFGLLRISVTGTPISDLTIQLAPGAVITGQIVFDGQAPLPDNPHSLRIGLGTTLPNSMCNQGRSEVFPDWTFRIEGATGACSMMPAGAGRWTMKSAGRDGLNLLDQQVRFAPGQVAGDVQVVFTDRRTELTLDVTDDHGFATREYVALVFPRDKRRWTENSRYVRLYMPQPLVAPVRMSAAPSIAAPPQGSREVVAGLPPGEYYVVAVEDLPSEGNRDAALLESLVSSATRITLTDAAPVRVTLRRRPPPQV